MAKAKELQDLEEGKITLSENDGVDEEELVGARKSVSGRDEEEEESENEENLDLGDGGEDGDEGEELAEDEEEERKVYPSESNIEPVAEEARGSFQEREEEMEEPVSPRREHTLNDLAEEDEARPVPTGVNPSLRPKTFRAPYEEDDDLPPYTSNIPHLGSSMGGTGVYSTPASSGGKRGGGLKLLLLAVVALLVLGGAVYLLKGRSLLKSSTPAPTEQPVSEVTNPTPIPTPSFDRSKYTLDILNGTAKTGLAASVSAKLKSLGYQIDKTGNATNSAFTRTQVLIKGDNPDLLTNLIQDLSPDFDATSGGVLKDSATEDAEVIIGAK